MVRDSDVVQVGGGGLSEGGEAFFNGNESRYLVVVLRGGGLVRGGRRLI